MVVGFSKKPRGDESGVWWPRGRGVPNGCQRLVMGCFEDL